MPAPGAARRRDLLYVMAGVVTFVAVLALAASGRVETARQLGRTVSVALAMVGGTLLPPPTSGPAATGAFAGCWVRASR